MSGHELSAGALSPKEAYALITSIVVPRPIAWVSTVGTRGQRNLAPFSYFTAVCSRPPTVAIGIGWHADGRMKDTLRHIFDTQEFCINHVSPQLATQMNVTSGNYEEDVSEWSLADLPHIASTSVRPPRIAGALVAMECKLSRTLDVGTGAGGGPATTLVLGEVAHFHLADGLLARAEDGTVQGVDPNLLPSVGRMGGSYYVNTEGRFEMSRPVVPTSAG